MKEENQAVIKALNMYGRVPKMWELLEEIERLNNIINEIEKTLDENVELTYVHCRRRQYNKVLTEGGLLFRDYIKDKLQKLKGGK